jgi:PAS domain S-box-containing protein
MKPLFAEILAQENDVLAIVSMEDFCVVECNVAFAHLVKLIPTSVKGAALNKLFPKVFPHEIWPSLKANLEKVGFSTLVNDQKTQTFSLNKIQDEEGSFFILRAATNNDNAIIEQYKMLFEKNVAGVYKTYYEGGLISCNKAFAQMLGFKSESEALKHKAHSFYPAAEDRERFLEDVRKNPILVNYELKLKRKDGVVITCLENTFMELDEEGKQVISGTIIDVTDQKNAENALLESEERFRTLSNVSHESVVFVRKDYTIVDCNDQFAVLFGFYNRLDIVGKRITEFISQTDLERITISVDISSANRSEIRTFDNVGKAIFLDVTGSDVHYKTELMKVLVLHDITARKRAEFSLEQTVVRFRNLLENSPNAIVILTDEKIKYVNQVAVELLGVDDEDSLFDKPFLDFIPSVYKTIIKTDLVAVREGAEMQYKEIRVLTEQGNEIDVGIQSTLTIYENRPSIQISLNNISERMQLVQEQMRVRIIEEINTVLKKEIEEHKRTQEKLEEQKNYTRNIIESSLDMIIAVDETGNITEFNKASQDLFGYSLEEILGAPMKMLYESKKEYDEVSATLKKSGSYSGEITNISKDNRKFTSLLSASLIINDKGAIIGSMGVSRDITEYRANERRALEQKAKLESIFNSTENMLMWTMDKDYKLTSFNNNTLNWFQEFIKEVPQLDEPILPVIERHLDENYNQGQLKAFDQVFNGKPQQFEFAVKSEEAGTIWLLAFLNPVYVDGKLEEVSCLMYDNTERKEIDRKIRDSLKEKEVLLQEVHHRVKNNLQVISSILNLQSSYVSDPSTLDILQESQNRIKSMSFIHETLYRTTDFSSINFSEYIKSLSHNLIQSYRLQNCTVDFVADIDTIEMSIDQSIPCGLIVNELVSNALKYAYKDRKKGKLIIELKEKGNQVSLKISDDGVGLPENFKYEKNDSLGVQLVYSLTEQLDGTIEVNSEKGTSFLITFEKRV